MSKQLTLSNFFRSTKETTDHSTSLPLSQHGLPQLIQTAPVVLHAPNTKVDTEADNYFVSKNIQPNDCATLTLTDIRSLSKNGIGLFADKDPKSPTEILEVLTNPWIPIDDYKSPQVLIHK